MPLFHCSKCHHEWEGSTTEVNCDWCNSTGYVLANETHFERFMRLWREGKFKISLSDRKKGSDSLESEVDRLLPKR